MDEINFTVIIPHKNLPYLLQRCIDSIPRRDDIEIIIVDDNSDPDKVDFENFPGKDRPEVKIFFDKSNKGAGAARNIGIRNACGKWLLFADCDDTYTSGLNDFLNEFKDSTSDIVYFKCNIQSTCTPRRVVPYMNIYIDNYIRTNKRLNDIKFGAWEPWNKLIKRSVVVDNCIEFDEISSSNDKMFSLYLGCYVKDVSVVDRVLYNYILRQGSIIHSGKRRFINSFETTIRQNELYHKIRYDRKQSILLLLLRNLDCVNYNILQKFWRYILDNQANPFEGFISSILFYFKYHVLHAHKKI